MKTQKTVYAGAEIVKDKDGREIGEVFQDDDEWGCLCYASDNGEIGDTTKEGAIKSLIEEHDQYIYNLRRKVQRLTKELKKWTGK